MKSSIEQIASDGSIILAPDVELSPGEMKALLERHMTVLNGKNPFECVLEGKRIFIAMKNITYLGRPHLVHKKRIQIPGTWRPTLQKKNAFLLGVYSYGGKNLFTLFDTTRYAQRRMNNSSAHVHTTDLLNARKYGEFQKTDSNGNHLITFTEARLIHVLKTLLSGSDILLTPELRVIDRFVDTITEKWEGKASYNEMLKANYNNALQGEWPGFFLEYKFSKFLSEDSEAAKICAYVQEKKRDGLDFDIAFKGQFLGDLKMHDKKAGAILGNDWRSFNKAMERDKKFWYVVINHSTVKDSERNYEVTRFWNSLFLTHRGREKDPLSYKQRMKHSVELSELMVLEANAANRKYIEQHVQGKNSDGKPRELKSKIPKESIDNFLIYRKTF
jgi:hypothetical protein